MSQKSASLTAVGTIGIDLGKNSFHLIGLDQRGAIVLQLKGSRAQLERRLANILSGRHGTRRIWVQVRPPIPERGDPGQIVEGYCDVRDGLLYVWNDTDASPIGTARRKPGDDVDVVARALLREKMGKHLSLHAPIKYSTPIIK